MNKKYLLYDGHDKFRWIDALREAGGEYMTEDDWRAEILRASRHDNPEVIFYVRYEVEEICKS